MRGNWILAIVLGGMSPAVSGEDPWRVLLVTGMNNHDWRATTPRLRAVLEHDRAFNVTVCENPALLRPDDLEGFDVLLSNFNQFGQPRVAEIWDTQMRAAFVRWIERGRGLVIVHAGSSLFYDWPEFQALAGTSWGSTSSHGRNHLALVSPINQEHPVVAGMRSFETFDEFWQGLELAPGATVLATVTPDPAFGGSGRPEPIALATKKGAGRGFSLLLGHDLRGMEAPGFGELLRRGTEWAATGRVVRTVSSAP